MAQFSTTSAPRHLQPWHPFSIFYLPVPPTRRFGCMQVCTHTWHACARAHTLRLATDTSVQVANLHSQKTNHCARIWFQYALQSMVISSLEYAHTSWQKPLSLPSTEGFFCQSHSVVCVVSMEEYGVREVCYAIDVEGIGRRIQYDDQDLLILQETKNVREKIKEW